jgi:SAM-dependent methyltransferase
MQPRLVNLLRCPVTLEPLTLEITEEVKVDRGPPPLAHSALGAEDDPSREILSGWLVAEKSEYRYPIVDGVPRLLADKRLKLPSGPAGASSVPDHGLSADYRQTVEHFRTQWATFAEEEKVFGRDILASWKYFRETLCPPDFQDSWFDGRLVLDAGCGHGKYVEAFSNRGIEILGMDITPEVGRVYRRLGNRANAHVIQANVLHPPLAKEKFDYVFSSGVIHHTPNTRAAFNAIAQLPRKRGYLAIWVYPFRSEVFDTISQALRAVTTRLPRWLLRPLCYVPVPLLSIPGWGAYSGTSLRNSSWRECAQVVYDFFGPQYQTHHTPEEVAQWFQAEGYRKPWFGPDPLSAVAQKTS